LLLLSLSARANAALMQSTSGEGMAYAGAGYYSYLSTSQSGTTSASSLVGSLQTYAQLRQNVSNSANAYSFSYSFSLLAQRDPNDADLTGVEYANSNEFVFSPSVTCLCTITGNVVETGTTELAMYYNMGYAVNPKNGGFEGLSVSQQYLINNNASNLSLAYSPVTFTLYAGDIYSMYMYSQVFSPATDSKGNITAYTQSGATGTFQMSVVVPEPSTVSIMLILACQLKFLDNRRKSMRTSINSRYEGTTSLQD
jgi:hypothetical protein